MLIFPPKGTKARTELHILFFPHKSNGPFAVCVPARFNNFTRPFVGESYNADYKKFKGEPSYGLQNMTDPCELSLQARRLICRGELHRQNF